MPRPEKKKKKTWYPKHYRFLMMDARCIPHMTMPPEEQAVELVLARYLGIHANLISPAKWRALREDLGRLLKAGKRSAGKTR